MNDKADVALRPTTGVSGIPMETNTEKFRKAVNKKYGLSLEDYWDLHEWSVSHIPQFWEEVWNKVGIIYSKPFDQVLDTSARFEDVPEWFRGARLNYAENVLRYKKDKVAFYVTGEAKTDVQRVTYAEVRENVALYASALKKCGVVEEDRVVGYITNSPPAAYAFFATTALGAVWSAVSLEFGTLGVLDRLQQVQPKILFASDFSFRDGNGISYLERLQTIVKELPSLEKVIISPFSKDNVNAEDMAAIPRSYLLAEFLNLGKGQDGSTPPIEFVQLPASHPFIISFTSGTTGKPKALVHSVGGRLVQALKESMIQGDSSENSISAMFTTVGWAAWGMVISSIHTGCGLLLYDGNPLYPSCSRLWDLVDKVGINVLILYPYMLDRCQKEGLKPRESHNLSTLRAVFMGGSCPKPQNWDYIQADVKPGILVMSSLGATDVMGGISTGNLSVPNYKGEIPVPCLGMAVDCFNDKGESVKGEPGELVITAPFPSMPLYILNDPSYERYKQTYFSKFQGVWFQGDLCMINPATRGLITLGRSDCVLNPKGRRFGSSEIYNVVEAFDEVEESVCVAQYNNVRDERVVLFLKMAKGHTFTNSLVTRIQERIKEELTQKHCPEYILEAREFPYTATYKKVEIAVKCAINGETIPNKETLVNPECLDYYYNIPELKGFDKENSM